MNNKISAVYKITNTVTGDFYIGSSKNVKKRWTAHKSPSRWNEHPNSQMYQGMQKYGVDKFVFEILEEVEEGSLKEAEQKFIEKLQPTYNSCNAKGLNIERHKETRRKYEKTDKRKKHKKEYNKKYKKSDKYKEYMKEYEKPEKGKESKRKYQNQLCFYNGEALTLNALSKRFWKKGITHPAIEAKKYLIQR